MFRRAVAGYDRFQVDTYVQWAEDELATADREREHLLTRHVRTQAALEEARELLSHSSTGGEFLRLSSRIGSMLAVAADQAESMRAEAEADRTAASRQAQRMAAEAARLLAEAEADAERTVAGAGRILAEAEHTRREARAEAAARLEKLGAIERRVVEEAEAIRQRAAEDADGMRQRAADEASAAYLQVRDEAVRMLMTGRDQRRRADAEAAAVRERLDRDAAARRSSLLIEIRELEHRRAVLAAVLDTTTEPTADTTDEPTATAPTALDPRLRGPFGWFREEAGRRPARRRPSRGVGRPR